MDILACFSATYAEAREKFTTAAKLAGGEMSSYENPNAKGPQGETLATDVAYFGPSEARGLLITCSGTHGVEGFCGSGAQVAALRSGLLDNLPSNVGLLMVHAINPYGFAHLRRVTEDNVDLNRNFIDHDAGHPANPAYDEVHDWLVPEDWGGAAQRAADAAIQSYIAQKGWMAFQAAVSGGQYSHADGLFYGGRRPTWSNKTFHAILERYARNRSRIGFIDFHTGLGPEGYGEPIYSGGVEGGGYERARAWYGPDVTTTHGGTSTSAVITGDLRGAISAVAPRVEVTPIALEYGTRPIELGLNVLRADNWLYLRGEVNSEQGRAIKRDIRDQFYVDTPDWKQKVVARAQEMTEKALRGLAV